MEHYLIKQKQVYITGFKPLTNLFNNPTYWCFFTIGLRSVITKQIIKSAIKTKGIVIKNKRKRTETQQHVFYLNLSKCIHLNSQQVNCEVNVSGLGCQAAHKNTLHRPITPPHRLFGAPLLVSPLGSRVILETRALYAAYFPGSSDRCFISSSTLAAHNG